MVSSKYVTISKHLFKYTSERFLHDLCNKMEVLSSNILHNRVQQVQGWQFGLLWNLSDNKNTMLQGSTFRKKTLGPAHSKFSYVVTSISISVAKHFWSFRPFMYFHKKDTEMLLDLQFSQLQLHFVSPNNLCLTVLRY